MPEIHTFNAEKDLVSGLLYYMLQLIYHSYISTDCMQYISNQHLFFFAAPHLYHIEILQKALVITVPL